MSILQVITWFWITVTCFMALPWISLAVLFPSLSPADDMAQGRRRRRPRETGSWRYSKSTMEARRQAIRDVLARCGARWMENVPIPDRKGRIDWLVCSRYGIFVIFQQKNQGYLFGDEDSAELTALLNGMSRRMPNPLKTCRDQARSVQGFLQSWPQVPVVGLVVAEDGCHPLLMHRIVPTIGIDGAMFGLGSRRVENAFLEQAWAALESVTGNRRWPTPNPAKLALPRTAVEP